MKKLLLLIFVASFASAAGVKDMYEANSSSVTGAVAGTQVIPATQGGDRLRKVVVGRCDAVASLFQVFDSSGQALQPITPPIDITSSTITGGCIQQFDFDLPVSSAISYSLTGSPGARVGIYFHRTSTHTTNAMYPTYP